MVLYLFNNMLLLSKKAEVLSYFILCFILHRSTVLISMENQIFCEESD